jgi:hypothetical protein
MKVARLIRPTICDGTQLPIETPENSEPEACVPFLSWILASAHLQTTPDNSLTVYSTVADTKWFRTRLIPTQGEVCFLFMRLGQSISCVKIYTKPCI